MSYCEFPKLYKLNSAGKLLEWLIYVYKEDNPVIYTKYGQVGGKIQVSTDIIECGKNIGKINETTAWGQAVNEAKSRWEKQFDKGYIDDIELAKKGKSKITIKPMLAHSFDKHSKKITFPAIVQPKLDGIRCIAVVDENNVSLFSRMGKPITSMTHIQNEISELFSNIPIKMSMPMVLDGELYCHELKSDFEKITSAVRKEHPSDGCEIIEYHLYDIVCDSPQRDRLNLLRCIVGYSKSLTKLKLVPSDSALNEEYIEMFYDRYTGDGYEGVMIRNEDSEYEQKRSYNLQKHKKFQEDEFVIVDIEEGRGKLKGHAAAFVCLTKSEQPFKAKMDGSLDFLKQCFDDHSLWLNKRLTVQYQGLTGKGSVPRFPVGKVIRDYE